MDKQAVVFAGVIAAALVAAYAGLFILHLHPFVLLALFLCIGFLPSFAPQIVEFKEYERGILFQQGRFKRVAGPGWLIVVPGFQSVQRVDLRTQVLDIHPQDVITKEQIRLKVDAVVYYKVTDAYKSVVEVKDYREALTQLLHSQIRNSISKLSVEDVIAGTDSIAKELHGVLANAEEQWGVAIKKVEIQSVELPKGLADAMQKRRAASDYKRKLETEAEARKIGIETVNEAASKISDRTLAYLYLDTLKRIGDGKATKIIFPLELTHIAELFAKNRVESNDYARIAEQLSRAYRERQKEELDGETDEKESPQAPVGHRKAPLKKLKGRAG